MSFLQVIYVNLIKHNCLYLLLLDFYELPVGLWTSLLVRSVPL